MEPLDHRSRVVARLASVVAASLVLSVVVSTQSSDRRPIPVVAQPVPPQPVVPGEVLVKFRTPPTPSELALLRAQTDADREEEIGSAGVHRLHSRSHDAEKILTFLIGHPNVAYAEPNYIVSRTLLPNDPMFGELWALQNPSLPGADISAVPAWDVSTGSPANVVAVIDSGTDYTHQDLVANMWTAPSAFTVTIGGFTITCPAGSHGFNAITNACNPMDDNDHGTHVSGTIGARGNNAVGVVGVNWTASVMASKFLDASGSGTTAGAVNAIAFAIQAKRAFAATRGANVRVLSASWGGPAYSQALLDEINQAGSNDMLFVAAAGNSNSDNDTTPFYPASFDAANEIAVAATDSTDFLASFSNYGASTVHLGAPGVGIVSTTIGNTYSNFSGTSMATPHVSGAAALVLSHCALDTAGLKSVLLANVDHLSTLIGRTITGGRLNVNNAIRNCGSPLPSPPSPPPPSLPPPVPSAPTGLVATAGNAQVALAWHAATNATSYDVKRGVVSGTETIIASGISSTSFSDTSVSNGSTYFYVVSAVSSAGQSGNSNEVTASPTAPAPPPSVAPPPAPKLRATAGPGKGKITLSWTPSTGATSYIVARSQRSGGPYTTIAGGVTSTSYLSQGLTSGVTYYYVVSAIDSAGTSGYSNQASARAK